MKLKKIAVAGALLVLAAALMYPQAKLAWYMVLYSVAFSGLDGSAANGSIAYCSDCTAANPCAGSGAGSMARREGGAWNCGGGAGGSSAFSALTSGSNTTAAMTVGTGASLGPVGTGTIAANLPVYCADAGSTDTYACSASPVPTGYVTGGLYRFKANTANTGTASINFNSLGAKTIVKVTSGITTTLADNDIRAGQFVDLVYDGTNMQMQSMLGNAASGTGPITHHIWLDAGSSDNSSPFANTWRASFANVDLDGYGFETGSSPAFATIAFRDAGSVIYFRYPIPSTYDSSPITVDLEADIDENNNAPSQLDITPSSTCVTDGGAYKGVTFTAGSVVSTAITSGLLGKRKKISFTMPATCAAGDRLIGKLERSASDTANNKILADGLTINIVF